MEKRVKAAELKKLPVGTKVKIHISENGLKFYEEGTLVMQGKYKVLRVQEFLSGVQARVITDLPGQFYTVEEKA